MLTKTLLMKLTNTLINTSVKYDRSPGIPVAWEVRTAILVGVRALERCLDLTDEHIAAALPSREATGRLLADLARIARPNEGASKILIVLARAAKEKCAWLGGPLLVEISPSGDKTELRMAFDRGGGVLEAVFPKLLVPVPLDELDRSLKVAARVLEPLKVYRQEGRIVLAPNRRMSMHRMPALLEIPRAPKALDFSALESPQAPKKR